MEKILFIAYHYPPQGGAGVQRTLKFTKYIRKYGWEPVILTISEKVFGPTDPTLLSDVPPGAIVERTSAFSIMNWWPFFNKFKLQKLISFIDQYLLIPDGKIIWQFAARKNARKLIRKHNIKLIFTTSGPYSAHLLGLHLKKKFPEISWLADFRDEWTTNPGVYLNRIRFNRLRLYIENKMENKVCQSADGIIALSQKMKERIGGKNIVIDKKMHLICNGFDPADFLNLSKGPRDEDVFTITYSGSFYGYQDPCFFFRAVRELLSEGAIDEQKLLLQFIGDNESVVKANAELYDLENVVKIYGYLEHKESLNVLYSSDALLLIVGCAINTKSVYTGKIFEYARIMKPVLGLVPPDGLAAEFIRDINCGVVIDGEDFDAVKQGIKDFFEAYLSDTLKFEINRNQLERYNREKLTARLSGIFLEMLVSNSAQIDKLV